MEKKDKITFALQELKKDPVRYNNLIEFARSKLTEEQKQSPIYQSILQIKIREVLSEYT